MNLKDKQKYKKRFLHILIKIVIFVVASLIIWSISSSKNKENVKDVDENLAADEVEEVVETIIE